VIEVAIGLNSKIVQKNASRLIPVSTVFEDNWVRAKTIANVEAGCEPRPFDGLGEAVCEKQT